MAGDSILSGIVGVYIAWKMKISPRNLSVSHTGCRVAIAGC